MSITWGEEVCSVTFFIFGTHSWSSVALPLLDLPAPCAYYVLVPWGAGTLLIGGLMPVSPSSYTLFFSSFSCSMASCPFPPFFQIKALSLFSPEVPAYPYDLAHFPGRVPPFFPRSDDVFLRLLFSLLLFLEKTHHQFKLQC